MAKKMLHRLPFRQDTPFSGLRIDREKPVHFEFNGRPFQGYEGDSVLSAVLGSGIDTFGEIEGEPLGLLPGFCPPVAIMDAGSAHAFAFPMERTPIRPGLKIRSFGDDTNRLKQHGSGLSGLARAIGWRKTRSLDFNFSARCFLPDPWAGVAMRQAGHFDVVIVGGGIGGLGAARAAMENGWRVALLEQGADLGGSAEFFGAIEGETRPQEFVRDLSLPVTRSENVSIFLNTRAVFIENGAVHAHQISGNGERLQSNLLELTTGRIILATGISEKLPIFPGNRLPGVMGARHAFYLARNYGVWRGQRAAYCTSASAATQVALLAADLGIRIDKLADSRPVPRSRFFEFAKAYGVSLATGTQVSQAEQNKKGELQVRFGLTGDTQIDVGDELETQRLVVCGGWQPDLMLWHGIGGKTRWNPQQQQLQAHGTLDDVQLAGACAGAQSMTQCLQSGEQAVSNLRNRQHVSPIPDEKFNEFESPDGPLPVALSQDGAEQCYLDAGETLARPQKGEKTTLWQKILPLGQKGRRTGSECANGYSLNDVAAKVILGELPQAYAGIFARERCLITHDLSIGDVPAPAATGARSHKADTGADVPAYLRGRFGPDESVCMLELASRERPETGCFVFRSREQHLPRDAAGCIIAGRDGETNRVLAYLAHYPGYEATDELFIRLGTQVIPCRRI